MEICVKKVINGAFSEYPLTLDVTLVPETSILSLQALLIFLRERGIIVEGKFPYLCTYLISSIDPLCLEPVKWIVWVCSAEKSGIGESQAASEHGEELSGTMVASSIRHPSNVEPRMRRSARSSEAPTMCTRRFPTITSWIP